MKREGSPPSRGPDSLKGRPHDSAVATVKEGGRSIHEIPREELRQAPEGSMGGKAAKEGSITQVSWRRVDLSQRLIYTNCA